MRGLTFLLVVAFTEPCLAQPNPQTQWSLECRTRPIEMTVNLVALTGGRVLIFGWTLPDESDSILPCALMVGPEGDSLAMTTFANYPGGMFVAGDARPNSDCRLLGYASQPGHSDTDALIVVLNPVGEAIGEYFYGGTGNERPYAGLATQDGGYLMVGASNSDSTTGNDVMLMKINADGVFVWQRLYGGARSDYATAISHTADHNYAVAGLTESHGAGQSDAYLLKVTPTGDTLWTRTYGGSGNDRFNTVLGLEDGSILCAGISDSANYSRILLVKVDADGGLLWSRRLSEAPVESAYAMALIPAAQGGFALAGANYNYFQAEAGYLVRLDNNGQRLWRCLYTGNTFGKWFNALTQTTDGGFVMAGTTQTAHSTPEGGFYNTYDFWVLKTGPDPILDVPIAGTAMPTEFSLSAFPNPFNVTTTLALDLPQSGPVTVLLVDALGRQAQTFDFPMLAAGRHELRVDGTPLASGVYFARVTAGSFTATRKLVLLK